MMRSALSLGVLGVSALALAACNPPHPRHGDGWGRHDRHEPLKVITRLDCPEDQGDLTRKAAAADGRSCDYVGEDGAVVSLQLTALTGSDAGPVLDPLAEQLRAELPTLPATPDAPKTGKDDKVDIDLPGVHIHADGDRASVDAGGDSGRGGVRVNADDHGAEVRIEDQNGPGVRKMMILTSDSPGPHGYQVVAYDARGPVGGPIVIATVKARDHDHDDLMRDVRDLVRHNVGG